jgi:predicted Zn-dependent protease
MKPFQVDLIEENASHVLSVDSAARQDYSFRHRCGLLKRRYNGSWESSARALKSVRQARSLLDTRSPLPKDLELRPLPPMDPGKVLRDHEYLFEFLKSAKLATWRVWFRCQSLRRLVVNQSGKTVQNAQDHFSLLVKARLKDHPDEIEAGEGNPRSFRFNLDGMTTRIADMATNYRTRREPPIGRKLPVVLDPGDGAIVFHEILGHSLEADHIHQGMSQISLSDVGREIVSPNVTISVDSARDPFFENWHSDDEGETVSSPLLVERGVLRGIISDSFYSRQMKSGFCGHSRVQDFTRIPMPRMYALYVAPGGDRREDLFRSTPFGIYAREFGDGKVLFFKNYFYFNIRDAFLIEDGKVTAPLGNIFVSGNIGEVLNSVDMVADDFRHDKGISYCQKNGQTLNVRMGQPTVKIDNLWISRGGND